MGGRYMALACWGASFFTVSFSGHIIDHECCFISKVHHKNEHICPPTMSRSVNDSCSARFACISTNSVDFSQLPSRLRNLCPAWSAECQRHVRCGNSQKATMSAAFSDEK